MRTSNALRIDPLPGGDPVTLAQPSAEPSAAVPDRVQPLHIDPLTRQILLDILVLPGFELHDLSCLADIFTLCNEVVGERLFARRLVGLTDEPVLSSTGFTVAPDLAIESVGALNNVVVLAGPIVAAPDQARLRQAVWRFSHGDTRYIAIGHGCRPLLDCGRRRDLCIAVDWELRDILGEIHPGIRCIDRPFHIDRRFLTCGGRDATVLLALHCIGRVCGDAVAVAIADRLNFDHGGARFSALPASGSPRLQSAPPILRAAIGIMSAHVEEPLPTSELARRIGYSCRELQRRFMRHYGIPPGKFYKNFRLDRGRRLLRQTCMSVTEVSLATGFKTVSHFSELYVRRFGNRPSQERRLAQSP